MQSISVDIYGDEYRYLSPHLIYGAVSMLALGQGVGVHGLASYC